MTIATLFVLSEAWIVGSAGDHNRGKIVAIYASVLSASFGAGPVVDQLHRYRRLDTVRARRGA